MSISKIFNDSKYTKWYLAICESASRRGSGNEEHHIIPRSMSGTNNKTNRVRLTTREHILCHILLTKMCVEPSHRKSMFYAARFMFDSRKYKTTKHASKIRETAFRLKSETQKGKPSNFNRPEVIKKTHNTRKLNKSNPFLTNNPMRNPESVEKFVSKISGENSYHKTKKGYRNKETKQYRYYAIDPGFPWVLEGANKGVSINKGVPKPKSVCPVCKKLYPVNTLPRHIKTHENNKSNA
jgi:hypothetical protein